MEPKVEPSLVFTYMAVGTSYPMEPASGYLKIQLNKILRLVYFTLKELDLTTLWANPSQLSSIDAAMTLGQDDSHRCLCKV